MYLRQLKLANYKSFFKETSINFEPGFNVLLGSNSSGKSSVLEAIAFDQFRNIPHRSIFNSPEVDSQNSHSSVTELSFTASFDEISKLALPIQTIYIGVGAERRNFDSNDIEFLSQRLRSESLLLEIRHMAVPDGLMMRLGFENVPSVWRSVGAVTQLPALQIENQLAINIGNFQTSPSELRKILEVVPGKIYRFSAERVIAETSSHYQNGELLANASNLAYCIAYLATSNPDLFKQLNDLLHRVFATIYWVSAPPNGNNGFELKVHTTPSSMMRSDLAVPISRVGTGVGNALAMLYVALTAQTQRYILLEEPNSYLHPRALRELLAILSEIGSKHQFFITTHSNDVLRTISASTVILLEYDGQQTTVKHTSGTKLHELQAGLVDIGISLTDLHGCDQIIWVEGESEAAVFPLMLRKFFPCLAQGIAVLPLHSTGDFEARRYDPKKVASIYRKLSEGSFLAPPMVAITLDREKKSDSLINQLEIDCAGDVFFLPRVMLEDYLLDVEAICAVINQEAQRDVTVQSVQQALSDAFVDKSCLLKPEYLESTDIHAARVLDFIFQALGQIQYRKTYHGPKIAEWLLANRPDSLNTLKSWFEGFIRSA